MHILLLVIDQVGLTRSIPVLRNVDEDDSADMIGRETEHAAKSKL
jgi:hypothetical protein